MLFIAILILIFLMYRFFTFRAEMVFTMSLIAPIMIVIGACYLPGKYHEAGIFLLVIGAFMLAVVLLICRLTARGVEKGLRLEYYKNLIIYGALKFLQNLSKVKKAGTNHLFRESCLFFYVCINFKNSFSGISTPSSVFII